MIGGDGNDRMQGGDGDDFVNGAAGDDQISGGDGSDLLVGLEGRDIVFGGGGDDEVFGGLGNDVIGGGAGDDDTSRQRGQRHTQGGEGDDHLIGNNGKSLIDAVPDADVAVFSGQFANYTITQNPDGTVMRDRQRRHGRNRHPREHRTPAVHRPDDLGRWHHSAGQIAVSQAGDTFMFRDDVMIQPHTGQLPDIAVDGGNAVVPAEELQVDMPTASAEAPPTIGIPVSDPDFASAVTALVLDEQRHLRASTTKSHDRHLGAGRGRDRLPAERRCASIRWTPPAVDRPASLSDRVGTRRGKCESSHRPSWTACNPLFVEDVVSTFPRRPGPSPAWLEQPGHPGPSAHPMGQVVRHSFGGTGEAMMSLALLSLRLLAALVLAASVAACDVFEGRQSVTGYADNSTITNSIRARYLDDPMVHFGDVGVTTLNGAVRLTGRVNSERERQRAAQIAREVKGVRGVNNEIAVR